MSLEVVRITPLFVPQLLMDIRTDLNHLLQHPGEKGTDTKITLNERILKVLPYCSVQDQTFFTSLIKHINGTSMSSGNLAAAIISCSVIMDRFSELSKPPATGSAGRTVSQQTSTGAGPTSASSAATNLSTSMAPASRSNTSNSTNYSQAGSVSMSTSATNSNIVAPQIHLLERTTFIDELEQLLNSLRNTHRNFADINTKDVPQHLTLPLTKLNSMSSWPLAANEIKAVILLLQTQGDRRTVFRNLEKSIDSLSQLIMRLGRLADAPFTRETTNPPISAQASSSAGASVPSHVAVSVAVTSVAAPTLSSSVLTSPPPGPANAAPLVSVQRQMQPQMLTITSSSAEWQGRNPHTTNKFKELLELAKKGFFGPKIQKLSDKEFASKAGVMFFISWMVLDNGPTNEVKRGLFKLINNFPMDVEDLRICFHEAIFLGWTEKVQKRFNDLYSSDLFGENDDFVSRLPSLIQELLPKIPPVKNESILSPEQLAQYTVTIENLKTIVGDFLNGVYANDLAIEMYPCTKRGYAVLFIILAVQCHNTLRSASATSDPCIGAIRSYFSLNSSDIHIVKQLHESLRKEDPADEIEEAVVLSERLLLQPLKKISSDWKAIVAHVTSLFDWSKLHRFEDVQPSEGSVVNGTPTLEISVGKQELAAIAESGYIVSELEQGKYRRLVDCLLDVNTPTQRFNSILRICAEALKEKSPQLAMVLRRMNSDTASLPPESLDDIQRQLTKDVELLKAYLARLKNDGTQDKLNITVSLLSKVITDPIVEEDALLELEGFKKILDRKLAEKIPGEGEQKVAAESSLTDVRKMLTGINEKPIKSTLGILLLLPEGPIRDQVTRETFLQSCKPFIESCGHTGNIYPLLLLWRNAPNMHDPNLILMLVKAFAQVNQGLAQALIDSITDQVEKKEATEALQVTEQLKYRQEGLMLVNQIKHLLNEMGRQDTAMKDKAMQEVQQLLKTAP